MKEFLESIGINVAFAIGGLFGALVSMGKQKKTSIRDVFITILSGTACANYLTPIILDLMPPMVQMHENGMAFVTGFLGLKAVEILIDRFIKTEEENDANATSN